MYCDDRFERFLPPPPEPVVQYSLLTRALVYAGCTGYIALVIYIPLVVEKQHRLQLPSYGTFYFQNK